MATRLVEAIYKLTYFSLIKKTLGKAKSTGKTGKLCLDGNVATLNNVQLLSMSFHGQNYQTKCSLGD